MNETLESAPLPDADNILQKIMQMQEEMVANNPHFEYLLKEIHLRLHKQPDLVHLLKEEDIGRIVAALAKKEKVVIGAALNESKSKLSDGRKLSQMTLDDI
jgi:hypothetical protein